MESATRGRKKKTNKGKKKLTDIDPKYSKKQRKQNRDHKNWENYKTKNGGQSGDSCESQDDAGL